MWWMPQFTTTCIGFDDTPVCEKVNPMCISLLQIIGYVNYFKETKYMSFLVKDHKFLKQYNKIASKISSIIEKAFDS